MAGPAESWNAVHPAPAPESARRRSSVTFHPSIVKEAAKVPLRNNGFRKGRMGSVLYGVLDHRSVSSSEKTAELITASAARRENIVADAFGDCVAGTPLLAAELEDVMLGLATSLHDEWIGASAPTPHAVQAFLTQSSIGR